MCEGKAEHVATTEVSAVLDAPVEDVWAVLGDFGTMPNYLTRVVNCRLESEEAARPPVGAVRVVGLQGGTVVRERLLAHDEVLRKVTYEIVGASRYPVRTYRAAAQAWPITSTRQTFVRWTVDFDAEAADEPTTREMIVATYDAILSDLAAHVTRARLTSS